MAKLVYVNTGDTVQYSESRDEHTHEVEKTMTPEIKARVDELLRTGVRKPKLIMRELRDPYPNFPKFSENY